MREKSELHLAFKGARKIHAASVSNRTRFSRRSQNEEYEDPVGSTAGLGNESIITLSLCILCFCHVSGISRLEYAPPRSQLLCEIARGVVNFTNFANFLTKQILTSFKELEILRRFCCVDFFYRIRRRAFDSLC